MRLTATPYVENMSFYPGEGGFPIVYVVDRNYGTVFISDRAQAPGQIIRLSMSGRRPIGTIIFYFEEEEQPVAADVQFSYDEGDWETLASFTKSDIQFSGTHYTYTCNVNGIEAANVRLLLTGSSEERLRVAEIEIYEHDIMKSRYPYITPGSKEFAVGEPGEITITSPDEDATIYYTTDGTEPSFIYSDYIDNGGKITVPTDDWAKTTTVKAMALELGKDPSDVVSATYTVASPYCRPTVPANGEDNGYVGQVVALTTYGAKTDANWTNPATADVNGHVGVIDNAFIAKAGESVALNITCKNTARGAVRVYADLNGNNLFDDGENIVREGSVSEENDALVVNSRFTVDPSAPAGKYLMRVFMVSRTNEEEWGSTDPCGTYSEGGYYDFAFNVEEPVPEDKLITSDTRETGDAAYRTVTVKAGADARMPVWTVGENTVSAQSLDIEIAADAATPEIALGGSGTITTGTISVKRVVKAGEWAFMSLPFAIDIAGVAVSGGAAVIDGNIRFLVYDGAQRANTSVEGYTKSGWTEKASGTIDANTGFAIAVNENSGDEQTVTFTAANFTMNASDKEIALSKYPAEVNGGVDADWNFKGNPMLQTADKGEGYSLYLYNPGDDTYDEYAGMESAIFAPFAAEWKAPYSRRSPHGSYRALALQTE